MTSKKKTWQQMATERIKTCFRVATANSHVLGNRWKYPNNERMSNKISEKAQMPLAATVTVKHIRSTQQLFSSGFFIAVRRMWSRRCILGISLQGSQGQGLKAANGGRNLGRKLLLFSSNSVSHRVWFFFSYIQSSQNVKMRRFLHSSFFKIIAGSGPMELAKNRNWSTRSHKNL